MMKILTALIIICTVVNATSDKGSKRDENELVRKPVNKNKNNNGNGYEKPKEEDTNQDNVNWGKG
jgi:hypothetical protein